MAESSSRDENPADLQSPSNAGNSSEGTGSPAAPVTAAVTIAPVSEPSESASQYSEPEEEEPKLEEPDEPDEPEDYSEDLEIEAEQGNDYYTPSEASDPRSDGRMDVRQSCWASLQPDFTLLLSTGRAFQFWFVMFSSAPLCGFGTIAAH